ncbi:hypothetical protein JKP88DRAFT_311304 [Tribonema minus]|uniref:Uncharacterized protein n=1 Tax=Tribonema minus TaxID=303371 RepID=A0A835Z2P0_9STRA|nr:hypothetical protein JKP88DRAFT_311304 [Tribonema minus]
MAAAMGLDGEEWLQRAPMAMTSEVRPSRKQKRMDSDSQPNTRRKAPRSDDLFEDFSDSSGSSAGARTIACSPAASRTCSPRHSSADDAWSEERGSAAERCSTNFIADELMAVLTAWRCGEDACVTGSAFCSSVQWLSSWDLGRAAPCADEFFQRAYSFVHTEAALFLVEVVSAEQRVSEAQPMCVEPAAELGTEPSDPLHRFPDKMEDGGALCSGLPTFTLVRKFERANIHQILLPYTTVPLDADGEEFAQRSADLVLIAHGGEHYWLRFLSNQARGAAVEALFDWFAARSGGGSADARELVVDQIADRDVRAAISALQQQQQQPSGAAQRRQSGRRAAAAPPPRAPRRRHHRHRRASGPSGCAVM